MGEQNFFSSLQPKLDQARQLSEDQKLHRYQGVLYPRLVCSEDHLRALDQLTARHDDILLAAYPKCGFNWTLGVLRKIVAEATGVEMDGRPPLIEFMGAEALKKLDDAPSPRLLGTHLHPDNIPTSFYENKTKMLVIFRNPKDTLVSYFHFSNNNPVLKSATSWETFYSDFMSGDVAWGSYFHQALGWDKKMADASVKVVTYEELKDDLSAAVRQISSFFGFSLTEEQVQRIAGRSTFQAMKEGSASSHGTMGNVFFRKGEVGDWKNYFTAEQSRAMDDAFSRTLSGTKLGDKLQYQKFCQ